MVTKHIGYAKNSTKVGTTQPWIPRLLFVSAEYLKDLVAGQIEGHDFRTQEVSGHLPSNKEPIRSIWFITSWVPHIWNGLAPSIR